MKLSPELWAEVEPLLSAALEMEADARPAWLDQVDRDHPGAARLLRRMLQAHERTQRSGELDGAPRGSRPASAYRAGARLGPFELVRPLGRGGMGEVWLARQVDGRVRREVALKLPAVAGVGELWRERFRRERDILARLEHPHIARFHDAGVADSGQPWLAMEYVAGTTLSDHLATGVHSLRERLALFRQILDAVAHAHRHLVVHRDLKPANVLVDAAGDVKLLDFGIAKLLEDGMDTEAGRELTRLGGRVMTLRYAAPEQAASETITTATDIYALGVVLHEIVAGLSPYRAVREGKALTEAMLSDEHSSPPSRLPLTVEFARRCGLATPRQLARALSGDLDAIALKAMRRDPARRYASVELFDADIAAHLERRPVKARKGTWRYLGARFAARHKLPLALAAAVLVTLVGGLLAVEGERRQAVAEKARAERHFASVRKLANTLIYEVHGKIQKLPGSLEAREMLIATSLEYLDALAGEPGRDPALLFEVASAYRRIADIQGEARGANRGNLVAAVANFEKSNELLVELERIKPGDLGALREHWRTSYSLAAAYFQVTDPRWEPEFDRAVRIAQRVAATPGTGYDERSLAVYTIGRRAHVTVVAKGRTPEHEADILRAVAFFERISREAPPEALVRERLAQLYGNAGVSLATPGIGPKRMSEAVGFMEKSLALARELRAEAPANAERQAYERQAILVLARRLAADGELRRANDLMAEAMTRVQETAARDPDDVTTAINRLEILVGAADIANRLDDRARAIRLSRDVLAGAEELPKEAARSRDIRMQVTEAKVILGYALLATAQTEALDRPRRMARLLEVQSLFGDVTRYIAQVKAEPALGVIPEYKLNEFAQARAQLDAALPKVAAR